LKSLIEIIIKIILTIMATYVTHTPTYATNVRTLYRSTQVVWYLLSITETILAFRFILKLLGANLSASFTQIIYSLSEPFIDPFRNVIATSHFGATQFEWSTLIAMAIYWVAAWGVVALIAMNKPVSHTEAYYRLSRQDIAAH
jgi:uncharacterized protein YggT (Ycf19 family)